MACSVKKLAHINKEWVFFKLDLVNAYNTQRREAALENIAIPSPELASFLRQFYGNDSHYFYRTGQNEHAIITAQEGIEQGDPAGPALFACGLKAPLDELRAQLRRMIFDAENDDAGYDGDSELEHQPRQLGAAETDLAAVFAYLDDTIVAVPPRFAATALQMAIDIFARHGHTVHPGKSACWSLNTQPEVLPNACRQIWSEHGLLVGGIPVFDESKEPVLAEKKLQDILAKTRKETEYLVRILYDEQVQADEGWSRVQATLLILRYSLAAKLIYFAQTINPEIVQPFADEFDRIIRDTYLKIIDVENLSEAQAIQIALPLKDGGCGLRTHTRNELERLFISSAMLIAPAVHAAIGQRVGLAGEVADPDAEDKSPYEACLEVCIANLERDHEIYRPDFSRADAHVAKVWAGSVSEKLTRSAKVELDNIFSAMPRKQCKQGRARVLSCSGIGAQWLATAPTSHLTQISDADMRTDIRFRLGKETFGGTVCPHVTAEGRECGEECDPEGYHLLSCSPGGGYFVGHDGVCATVSNLTASSDGIPGAIADWKPQVSVWPRATRGAEADVGFYRLPGSRDTYVDAVCSLANPETYPSCERKAGWLAEHKARAKNRDHPIFDSQTHRRMHPFDFCALSFERHGFWAKETVGFIKKLASSRAVALGLEPSEEIRRWYAVISCCIQRSNAKILRGEPVPGRPTPLPSRFAAMGRDLGFAA